MNILSNRIVDLVWKGIISRWIILTAFLLLFAGAQNISAEPEPRIVGGNEVKPPFKYTWMAALIKSTADPTGNVWSDQFCGGTLIQPDLVVTAAHCFYDKEGNQNKYAQDVDVLLGAHDLTASCNIGGCEWQRIKVSQLTIHEEYNATPFDNDIALLKLAKPVQGLSAAALISLPSLKDPGTTATAIGWGYTGIIYPEILQEVDLPLVSQTTCKNAMESLWPVTDNMLCAGYEQGGRDSCFGDSGGPLVVQNPFQKDRWELTGIVSWGEDPCAAAGEYGVYVNVYNYLDWIEPPSLTGAGVLLLLLDD